MKEKLKITRLLIALLLTLPSTLIAADPEPVWFNSGMNNRDITFSPDGRMMLTTLMLPKNQSAVIAISHQTESGWSPLEIAPFSGRHPDIEPAFSPDGKTLYFASKRPVAGKGTTDWDLWRVAYRADGNEWGDPVNLGEPVNTIGNEFYPSVTSSGRLYFTATREDTIGKEDLYVANPGPDGFVNVMNVGEPVNSEAFEFNAFIAPDESYLIFGAQRRPGEIGGGDLYISHKTASGFSEPALLPASVNTPKLDYCPTVWNDRLYFTSERSGPLPVGGFNNVEAVEGWSGSSGNGLGDIYWLPAADILLLQPED